MGRTNFCSCFSAQEVNGNVRIRKGFARFEMRAFIVFIFIFLFFVKNFYFPTFGGCALIVDVPIINP
ncbi:hypothetical protein BDV36DRAFT_274754 [Aspergillus pseudocaelatus]|uniref:Uncharacterized protein n=1 Tax=Aspergillus pseudocaelatus TaxID=1825620 RepID=A0ABQ6W2L4_9EURO|nr:hypothetical protein BDV36DRAFT_274754 [Aspergillus pseudocaelatus]